MSSHHQPRVFHITDIVLKLTDKKASEVYVVFSVSGRAEKEKTAVIVAQKDEACVSWKDSIIEIEIPDPTKAEVLVKAYSKRALLPDRLLGEFSVVLAHPGATANLSGELAKKKTSSGTLSFKIYPKGNSKLHHGAVVTNRHSAYPGAQTLQQPGNPGVTVAGAGQVGGESKADAIAREADARASAVTYEAEAETAATAAEAQQRTNAVAQEAAGRTVAVADSAEGKLARFREDLKEGKHRPHHHDQATQGTNQGQGAYSRTVGIPEQAGTAADGDQRIPSDSPAGGSVAGPVAPTGQGGVLPGTGAGATTAGTPTNDSSAGVIRKSAVAATEKAEGALERAKQEFS